MSKVFIVRFHVIQFTRYSALPALAVSLAILSHSNSFVKYFFQVFQLFSKNFSFVSLCDAVLVDSFDIITDATPFVKHFLQNSSSFFVESANKNRGPFSGPRLYHDTLLYIIDQTVTTVIPAIDNSEGTVIVLITECEEVMIQ